MKHPKLVEEYTFQKRVTEPADELGSVSSEWVSQFKTRSSRIWMRGGEEVLASRLSGVQPAIITVRLNPDTSRIDNFWRCIDNRTGATYNVMTAEPSQNRQYIDLMIKGGGADG